MADYYQFFPPLAIAIPLIAAVALLVIGKNAASLSKQVAFIGFGAPFVLSVWFAFAYYTSTGITGNSYQAVTTYNTGLEFLGISLKLGLNGISTPMFLLAGIVGFSAGIYAMFSNANRLPLYLSLLLFMQAGLMGTFAAIDIFFFYFFHELALIPTFIMIGIWGGQGRRAAAMEMTIYLTLGAMLSLIGLITIYLEAGISNFDLIALKTHFAQVGIEGLFQNNTFALLLFGFGILVSLWPFHWWAPRGYAAAPSSAAMLHAGVLKKFGLYGLVQIAAPLLPNASLGWMDVLVFLALGNVVIIGFVTMAQRDLKLLIGYASVMHMGYAFLGIATLTEIGVGGAVLLMFAHGLSAALLFMLATSIYRRTGTYDLKQMGGLGQRAPLLGAFFVLATLASIGLPGFANFWGEFTIFIGLWESPYRWATIPAALGIIISAIYGLRAVANIFFGQPCEALVEREKTFKVEDVLGYERVAAGILILGLLAVGLYPNWMSQKINDYVKTPEQPQPVVLHINEK